MGAHNTDHENNKIKQEHWKDLISLWFAEGRTDDKPASALESAIMITEEHLLFQGSLLSLHFLFFPACITDFCKFVFGLVMKVTSERLRMW